MSSSLTHSPMHLSTSHSKWSVNACVALLECGRGKREHSKVASVPRFYFQALSGEKRRLFYFQQPKRKSALLETCLFMEMVEDWVGKRSRESSGKIWSSCRGRCDTSFARPERNMGCRCLKEFDLQLECLLSSWPHPEVFLSAEKVEGVGDQVQ